MTLIVLAVVIIVILLWMVLIYNTLIRQKNQVQEGWSGIDVQLKRRYDLIPNLVEAVKAYAGHESSVFEHITELRAKLGQTNNLGEKAQLNADLSMGLSKLIAIAENYPSLKANENFIQLQQELSTIEDQIQMARRYYNGTARDYNTSIQSFPQVMIANSLGFTPFTYFEIATAPEREVPQMNFNKEK
jgi:LemA protein